MELKWKYDSKHKQWWVDGLIGDEMYIDKVDDGYTLNRDYFTTIGTFKKLKSAKLCAHLICFG